MPLIAVLIDADNIPASAAPRIFAHTANQGTAVVKRIYGRLEAINGWAAAAALEFCEARVHGNVGPSKNGADIALAIDAMDILHTQVVDTFCIVSNDRDFVPLAIRLRAAGKSVHAICKQRDDRYAKAFDSVLELMDPIIAAFRKISTLEQNEFSLAEAGKLLREASPGLIPPPGKGRLRKVLDRTGAFEFTGTGGGIRVRLKD